MEISNILKQISFGCDCEGEFGDGDGTEEGYENCLWECGEDEEEEKNENNTDEY